MRKCLAILLVAALVGSASAGVLIEEFETDPTPRGWIADGSAWHATGGVGDSGYYSGTRSTYHPWVGIDLGAGEVNIPALLGSSELDVSIDAKSISGTTAGYAWEIYGIGVSTAWKYDFQMVPPTEWTNYRLIIDTTMTDAEAQAAGWARSAGSGSFADVWQSARWLLFTQAAAANSSGTITFGVDNLRVVPEPATLSLLATGVVGLVLRRRRRA